MKHHGHDNDNNTNVTFGTICFKDTQRASTRDTICSCVHYFKLPKEFLVTTVPCWHFEVWAAAVSSLWGHWGVSLRLTQVLLYSSHVTFQESLMTQTCFCSVFERKSFFCTQRKAVTEHRYLTRPCRGILIQWEQGRVMYRSIVMCVQDLR